MLMGVMINATIKKYENKKNTIFTWKSLWEKTMVKERKVHYETRELQSTAEQRINPNVLI